MVLPNWDATWGKSGQKVEMDSETAACKMTSFYTRAGFLSKHMWVTSHNVYSFLIPLILRENSPNIMIIAVHTLCYHWVGSFQDFINLFFCRISISFSMDFPECAFFIGCPKSVWSVFVHKITSFLILTTQKEES